MLINLYSETKIQKIDRKLLTKLLTNLQPKTKKIKQRWKVVNKIIDKPAS